MQWELTLLRLRKTATRSFSPATTKTNTHITPYTMEHAFANALKKGFELRDTSEFAVFCASSEKAFKIVAKPVASTAAPRGETKSSKPASAPAAEDDDDDLDNMFGDSDDEDEDYFNSAEAQALAKAHQAKLDAKRKK